MASTGMQAPPATGLQATPTSVNFGSEAINLEYAFLSSMFSYPLFNSASALPASSDTADLASATNGQQQPMLNANSTISIPNSLWAPPLPPQPQPQPLASASASSSLAHVQSQTQSRSLSQSQSQSQGQTQSQLPPPVPTQSRLVQHHPQMAAASSSSLSSVTNIMQRQDSWQGQSQSLVQHETQALAQTTNGISAHGGQQQQQQQQRHLSGGTPLMQPSPPPHAQIVGDDTHNPLSRPPTSGPAVYGLNPVYPQSPAQVYSSVTEPYKYYNGFHFFFRHICGRMGKKDIMRISRAIAHFRPSLVALLRNLTYEDLIFMEKSFQRALMEYEKLIGFIGTPTVVWRRSGEIALVGKEFSILTQWDRQLLMAGNRFIFELMDTSSAVVYWERFAEHAFENSEHSVMSECRLVRPDGVAVPCAFSFTIKRDLFGIPMAIIGNFLPIL
ncbi:Transcriptional regulator of nonfermentable carbon utilization [Coemansia sp. RSA 2599]|nr:Transcriptional regulator of nonfermentable carbon utilization [Coemansia sp. RSA 2598]KAJ1811576.1 Transcriptional regulator of nonfermentable carbon utilization [Coemansia sp. RSA 2599]